MFVQKAKSSKRKPNSSRPDKWSRPIQAKVGFEFQSAVWMLRKCSAGPPEADATEEEQLASSRYLKGHVLFENAFWSAQTDVDEDRVPMLELVTVPFEESPEGFHYLRNAVRDITAFFDYVFQAPHYVAGDKRIVACEAFSRFGEIKSPEACFILPKDNPNPVLFPQATAGIKLNKLNKLLRDISAPLAESGVSSVRKHLGRVYLFGDPVTGDFNEGAPINGRYAVYMVDEALGRVRENWRIELSDAFKGFLTQVVFYLLEGHRGSKIYAKGFIALLARTDFSRMFSLLPESEKEFLARNNAEAWLEIVRMALPDSQKDFSQPFFADGIFQDKPEIHRFILKGLTKEQWLKEMTRGRDLLTERNFPNRFRAYELESLGAMGDRTDTVLGEPAPVFEFRTGKKYMNAREAMSYAVETFKTIYALNRGMDHYFGELLDVL
ncbi:MAG: hypothetical protein MI784_11055 [Cytophagales bacterium]|nr:hypothetical protein [Cytophagales bacterium]